MSAVEITQIALYSKGGRTAVHGGSPPCRCDFIMTDYEKIYDFENLYKAHTVARRSKRNTREVIEFEMNLGKNLTTLSDALKNGT